MPRSFIAIDSNEKIRESLRDVQRSLNRTGADLKIVEPENVHLTLRFLGDVPDEKINTIKSSIHELESQKPFEMGVNGLGTFPNPNYIRVIWAGVKEGAEKVKNVWRRLNETLAEAGYPSERDEYTPHLTIARMKSGKAKESVASVIESRKREDFGSKLVKSIELKKSELTPEGPIYSTIERVDFS